mmetsp:Transcript_65983/g.73878  ORF Transcript_65983/g.73878 Transcript_65983/m.73878 type:complete len:84 (-) Transcript_65983:550-801(-)
MSKISTVHPVLLHTTSRQIVQKSTSNNVLKGIERCKKKVPVLYNTLRLGNTYGLTNKDSTIKQIHYQQEISSYHTQAQINMTP